MLLHWAFPLGISEAVYFFCSMFSCTNILKCLEYPTLQSPLEYPLCLWQCGGPYFQFQLSFFVKEPKIHESVGIGSAIGEGWRQLIDTINDIKHLHVVGTFLLAYWLYIDGVDTIIKMAVDYGSSLGFPSSSLITALLLVQFIAFPATLGYYWFASKIGIKKAVYVAIMGYTIITIFGVFMTEQWHFYTLAILIACFQGGIQALSRSMYSRIIPKEKSA